MRQREPWQHEWGQAVRFVGSDPVKPCTKPGCLWEMLSRKNSNRYRNGPEGEWKHSPKDCMGSNA